MLNAISWQGYWTFLALLSTAYYCLIGLLFYRQEIISRLISKRVSATDMSTANLFDDRDGVNSPLSPTALEPDPEFQAPPLHTEEYTVYACMDEFNAFFEGAKSRKWSRTALLQSIRNILSKYPSLKGSEYQDTIIQVISSQCEQYCSIHLKEEDRLGLW